MTELASLLGISLGVSECELCSVLQPLAFIQIASSSVIHSELKKLEEDSDIEGIMPAPCPPLLHL